MTLFHMHSDLAAPGNIVLTVRMLQTRSRKCTIQHSSKRMVRVTHPGLTGFLFFLEIRNISRYAGPFNAFLRPEVKVLYAIYT